MNEKDIYNAIRGFWRISKYAFKEADYFLGLATLDNRGKRF